ncbi:uncharacterized protein J4E88_008858 [Alternaria novae-zelandiae]|uniref:uncharacterized protein n=1 Tax=Alternaria novae-zelandiae TaxID=430562 RepID=UPI0020C1F92E|nr:uncharacterized protein J4E88_008858 [Alternaria novae-zelandiae]KAI4673246.1 hypothetical protein J4E88_008858 [Alternaria novae-zelandiae]
MSLTLKVTSLFVRTLAKPVANAIKRNAHEHDRFRRICVKFAQGLHRVDMRMRLGLLQDPAVIDRQIKKEVQLAEAARKKAAAPTVLTEEEMKAEEALTEKEREAIKKKTEERIKPRIRPLSEQKAIEMGANFAAETFIFAVGIAVILVEQWRQRRKARNARDDIREDLEEVQAELKAVKAEFEEFKAKHPEPASSKILGFFTGSGKKEDKKPEAVSTESKPVSVETQRDAIKSTNATSAMQEQSSADKPSQHKDLGILSMGLPHYTNDIEPRPDEKEQPIIESGEMRSMNVVAPAQLDGGADYYSRAPNDKTIPSQQGHYPQLPRQSHNAPSVPPPPPRQPSRTVGNAVNDLLPYCTTEPPLSQAQVIALSDVVGSLKELVVLALGAASGVPRSMEKLEGAVGSQAAVNIVEFFADEWEIEG